MARIIQPPEPVSLRKLRLLNTLSSGLPRVPIEILASAHHADCATGQTPPTPVATMFGDLIGPDPIPEALPPSRPIWPERETHDLLGETP